MPSIRVVTLGAFRVEVGGTVVPEAAWRRRKARQLFKYLLTRDDRRALKDELIELLWPESEPSAASTNLRTTVRALRLALGTRGHDLIVDTGDAYALHPDVVVLSDVEEFERTLADAAQAADPLPLLERAQALYEGDYLPDDLYEDFATAQREHLKRIWSELQHALARQWLHHNDEDRAAAALLRLVDADPCDERATQELMELLARLGRRSDALRVYQRLVEALRSELDVAPSSAIWQLHHEIAQGSVTTRLRDEPRRDGALRKRPDLPIAATRLIGRERDLRAVVSTLQSGTVRLLTLIGPGGVGKSRLALAAAAELEHDARDGVWFIDLSAVRDPALVVPTIARALGIHQAGPRSALGQVLDSLIGRTVLLILDNFEQVLDAAPDVAAILVACARVKILATSREPLRLRWEHLINVSPLAVPDPDRVRGVEDLQQYSAVSLLVERARAADSMFELSQRNAVAIAQLCHRLDGLPLALELAGARLRALPPQLLAGHLAHQLRLLDGSRDAPERHRSLEHAIGWSYDLMPDWQQLLFARLGVFAGGCTLEAAQLVCDPENEVNVVSGVGALVDRSLVRRDVDVVAEEPRYHMLQTVREFARGRLLSSDESRDIQQRHAHYYASLAERSDAELTGPQQALYFDALQRDHDNLRAALTWCLEAGDTTLALRLGGAMGRFWLMRGYVTEGVRWLHALLELPFCPADKAARARVLMAATRLEATRGEYARAKDLVHEALGLWRELDSRTRTAQCMSTVGAISALEGDYAAAWSAYQEALQLWRAEKGQRGAAVALIGLGVVARHRGGLQAAETFTNEALALLHELGDEDAMGRALLTIASLAHNSGDNARAKQILHEQLQRFSTLGDVAMLVECLEMLAGVIATTGDPVRAARLFGAAQAELQSIGLDPPPSRTARFAYAEDLAALRQRLDPAMVAAAWAEGRALSLEQAVKDALDGAA